MSVEKTKTSVIKLPHYKIEEGMILLCGISEIPTVAPIYKKGGKEIDVDTLCSYLDYLGAKEIDRKRMILELLWRVIESGIVVSSALLEEGVRMLGYTNVDHFKKEWSPKS